MKSEKFVTRTLLKWHKDNRRSFPWRDETDPYKVFIAEFFLQKTPAKRVANIYPNFIAEFPTPYSLVDIDYNYLVKKFGALGLHKRMKWLVNSMKIICSKHEGNIPSTKRELLNLPGIGEYTGSAILSFAFHKKTPIIDTNVIRILTRFFRINEKDVKNLIIKVLPDQNHVSFNEAILDFSALICKKKPMCQICILKNECKYYFNLNEP